MTPPAPLRRAGAALLLPWLLAAACAGRASSEAPTSPGWVTSLHRASSRALDDARDAAATATSPVRARRNEAACACPPWEVHVWGAWQRVELRFPYDLEPPEDLLPPPLTPPSSDPNPMPREVRLHLEFRGDAVESDTGWRFPVADVLALSPAEL